MARVTPYMYFLLLMFSWQQTCTANPFLAVKEVFDIGMKVYEGIEKVQDFINQEKNSEWQTITAVEKELYHKLDKLSKNVNNMRKEILEKITVTLRDKLTEKTDELFDYIGKVQSSFNNFYSMFRKKTKFPESRIVEFAEVSTSYSSVELRAIIEKMHNALVDLDFKKESVLTIIARNSTASDIMCIKGESPQKIIYDLFRTVVDADIKGLLVKLFSYDVLAKAEKSNKYKALKNAEKTQHLKRLKETYNKVKQVMRTASREFWKCDPPNHIKDITYAKLQEVFQGFFAYKLDNTRITSISNEFGKLFTGLSLKCSDLKDDRYRCVSDVCKAQPENKRCTGHLRDCQYIAKVMDICHAPTNADRRYEWMNIRDTDTFYGGVKDKPCSNSQGLVGHAGLDICFCNCESESMDMYRYFSLQNVTSNVAKNKVITGVRFVKDTYVFHIQIQQGTLGPNGNIEGKPTWRKVQKISHVELTSWRVGRHYYNVLDNSPRNFQYDEWTEFYNNDLVYSVIYDRNTVYLDDFDAPQGELLTGLRFHQVGKDLRMEFQTTQFDYATGKLKPESSSWSFNKKTREDRRELLLSEPGDPAKSGPSNTYSQKDQLVRFRMSDLKKDLGQVTVPFIDLQSVVSKRKQPLPISGAGLFHKSDHGGGGFLALKLIHYDFVPHM